MDPQVTLDIMHDAGADIYIRYEAAENLREWLQLGGFAPGGRSATTLLCEIREFMSRHNYCLSD